MTDLPSSLGIEAVECVAEGGRSLTVRVTGRWRRRRPELRGQPMLVVETETGRQRFLAMPEPPSLTGAAPGTWRMSFSVPAALAPALPGRTFLQLGGVMVPLPIGEVTIAAEGVDASGGPAGPRPDVIEARRIRGSELAAESARRRAAELAAEVERLEQELADARAGSDGLRDVIAEGERQLRRSEQTVHAERSLRTDLEQEMSHRMRGAQHDLRVLHDRVAELERELTRMRRAVDEAGHLAAAAEAARAEAERRLAEGAAPPPSPAATDGARAEQSRRELALDRAARGAPLIAPPLRPFQRAGDRVALAQESAIAVGRTSRPAEDPERLAVLERELVVAHEEIEVQRRRSARAYEAIELVRGELRRLQAAGALPPAAPAVPEPAAPVAEETPAPDTPPAATAEPVPLAPPEAAPEAAPEVAPPEPPDLPPARAEPVRPERLSEALARLRERSTPAEPAEVDAGPLDQTEPSRAVQPWLRPAFRRLAAQDASAAGRLLLALLPAQRAADPHPVAYDLVLSDVLVAHVTSDSVAVHVDQDATVRPRSEVDFQLVGDLASVARLLRAGRVRRRLRLPPRRMARVRGDRGRMAALDRLIDARLSARELHTAGARLDPVLAFTLAGLMIEPGWTEGERFTIGHREADSSTPDAFLHVRDGRPLLSTPEPPHGPVPTVLVSAAGEVLGALAGAADAQVMGEQRPLALLRQWLDRAQSG